MNTKSEKFRNTKSKKRTSIKYEHPLALSIPPLFSRWRENGERKERRRGIPNGEEGEGREREREGEESGLEI